MTSSTTNLNVEVKFTAFDDKRERVLVKKLNEAGRQHFRVRIFLEGPDIDQVDRVVYTLHPTFPNPRREISTRPRFELIIWTWGIFSLDVEIYAKSGQVDHRAVMLDYSAEIETARRNNQLFWAS